jgi:hypothetical protein
MTDYGPIPYKICDPHEDDPQMPHITLRSYGATGKDGLYVLLKTYEGKNTIYNSENGTTRTLVEDVSQLDQT